MPEKVDDTQLTPGALRSRGFAENSERIPRLGDYKSNVIASGCIFKRHGDVFITDAASVTQKRKLALIYTPLVAVTFDVRESRRL